MMVENEKQAWRVPEPTLSRLPWYLAYVKLLCTRGEQFVSSTQIAKRHKAFLFGVGSLGASLLHDTGLRQYGLEIVAGFDVRPELVATRINDIPVYHMDEFPERQAEYGATIGVLTVPVEQAQAVTDRVVSGGIRALWNFTPFRIRVPEPIVVQDTLLYAHLAVMFNRMNTQNQEI